MSGIISWVSLPPVDTIEERGGLKGSLSVCVCEGRHLSLDFPFWFFVISLLPFGCVCLSDPEKDVYLFVDALGVLSGRRGPKKIWPTLEFSGCFMTHLLFQDYLCFKKALQVWLRYYFLFFSVFGILSRFLVRNKLLLGTTTVLRVRVAVLLTCAQQQTSNQQGAWGSVHCSVKFVTQTDGHQGETASMAFKYMEYMDINTWICHIRVFISY